MEEKRQTNAGLVFGTILGAAVLTVVLLLLFQSLSIGTSITETFEVTNPAIDQECTLQNTPSEITRVEQYEGSAWEDIDSGDYSLAGRVVTVDSSALYS
jgi:hypothetical protein